MPSPTATGLLVVLDKDLAKPKTRILFINVILAVFMISMFYKYFL